MNAIVGQLLLLMVLGMSGGAVYAAADVASFTITISSPQNTWKAGSDVVVSISLINTSNQRIFFRKAPGQAFGERFMDVEATDDQGKSLPRTKYYHGLRTEDGDGNRRQPTEELAIGGSVSKKFLKPGETLQDGIVVSKLFDLSRAGKYTIRVQRRDEGSKSLVMSNTITLTISD